MQLISPWYQIEMQSTNTIPIVPMGKPLQVQVEVQVEAQVEAQVQAQVQAQDNGVV